MLNRASKSTSFEDPIFKTVCNALAPADRLPVSNARGKMRSPSHKVNETLEASGARYDS